VEGLRIDPAHDFGGLRLNQWTSILAILVAFTYLYVSSQRPPRLYVLPDGRTTDESGMAPPPDLDDTLTVDEPANGDAADHDHVDAVGDDDVDDDDVHDDVHDDDDVHELDDEGDEDGADDEGDVDVDSERERADSYLPEDG